MLICLAKAKMFIFQFPGPEINKTRFIELMYPYLNVPHNFVYSSRWLFPLQGILSAELKIQKASNKKQKDEPATFFIKCGLITHTTISHLSGFKSCIYHCFTPGSQDSLEVVVCLYSNDLSLFSKAGDSGSIIVDTGGKFVAFLTAGGGLTDSSDLTYGSPM